MKLIKKSINIAWRLCKWGAFTLGMLIIGYLLFTFLFLWVFREETLALDIPLRSGFAYHYDMKDGRKNGHHLRDKSYNIVVYSDVLRFMESGNTIYGYRRDLHDNPFYFICDYGTDCSGMQNLTDVQLRQMLEERKLPLYTQNSGVSRQALIREMEDFYKEFGKKSRPRWYYDKEQEQYRTMY